MLGRRPEGGVEERVNAGYWIRGTVRCEQEKPKGSSV